MINKKIIFLLAILLISAGCQKTSIPAGNENASPKESVNSNTPPKNEAPANELNANRKSETPPPETNLAVIQKGMSLQAVGNGEKVRLTYQGKSKVIDLENDFAGDFSAGGDPPHRYTVLLSIAKGEKLYLVAGFRSGPAISDPDAPCGGDQPSTLLLIQADRQLSVEKVQTEVFDSCIYNGAGRYPKGKPAIGKEKVAIAFEEGNKKYDLVFDAAESDKGLQLNQR